MFGGEGEPLLHKDIATLTRNAYQAGLDVAFTTNGVFLTPTLSEQIVNQTEWIKVSCNAGTPETYSKIHRTQPGDFEKVINNLRHAARFRTETRSQCVLGLQLLLLPENKSEIRQLATIAKEIGMDYLVVKPYSHHPGSKTEQYRDIVYEETEAIIGLSRELSTEQFQLLVRLSTMESWNAQNRKYDRCFGLPFWSYMDSAGNIWGCSSHLGNEHFLYGNIFENTFWEIWHGEKRLQSLKWMQDQFDINSCRINCRMDKINHYLWELTNPPRHVNFI